MLDYVILGTLALHPMSGYDLGKRMDGPGRFIGYRVGLPQIYRTLAKLTDRGLVAFDVDPRDGRPAAKVYRLTAPGQQALLEWAHSPYEPAPRPMDPDFMLRFLFAGILGHDIAIGILRTELEYRRAQRHDPMSIDELVADNDPIADIDPAWAAHIMHTAHEYGRSSMTAYIAWLEATLAEFENSHPAATSAS
ncbi:PadR family transcriptional regulator [Nocardia arthritidis]|uniref:PadR family transcriptional regulator n=1 Tax=Nocardia arthritidis TaxID=228602 RepID=A0A6G9YPC8_9NOCA|nr:PadR family transcriptional regulator [Nocardia arthritidis]QIS14937.1 PadR family transcriptional regulator [Nocardia arthritidis]